MLKFTFYIWNQQKGYSEPWCCYIKPEVAESLCDLLNVPKPEHIAGRILLKHSFCKLREGDDESNRPKGVDDGEEWAVHVKTSSGPKRFDPYYYKTRRGVEKYLH